MHVTKVNSDNGERRIKMLKQIKNKNFWILIITDFLIITLSLYLSLLIRFDFVFGSFTPSLLFFNLPIFFLVKMFLSFYFKIYKGMWRYTSLIDIFNIILMSFVSFLIIIMISWFFVPAEYNLPRSIYVIDLITCTFLLTILRLYIRSVHQFKKSNILNSFLMVFRRNSFKVFSGDRRIVIVGAGDSGEQILRETITSRYIDIKVVGFFDDDPSKIGSTIHGVSVLGSIQEINNFVDRFEEIIICTPSASREQMRRIVDICKETQRKYRTLPALWELIDGTVSIDKIREVSVQDILGRNEVVLDRESINNNIKGKRVLVTGAGGSIGSELVRQCFEYEPSLIIMLDFSEYNIFNIERECRYNKKDIKFITILADVRNRHSIENYFKIYKPDIIIHAAAYKHVPIQEMYPWEAVNTNVKGSLNLINLAEEYKVESFVFVSTDKAVKPTNIMGATKRIVEMIIHSKNQNSHTRFMAVRFGNVIGSSGSVIPIFQEQIKNGMPVTVTHPKMERYFMSIPEAAQLILQAGALGEGGEIFVLNMGNPVKIDDIAKDIIKLSGYTLNEDAKIEYTGVRPGEKLHEELMIEYENLVPTTNKKIMILKSNSNIKDTTLFYNNINSLLEITKYYDAQMIKKRIMGILPEYKPARVWSRIP